ncbi:LysR family transcriptional regulator [Vineibacter terrae]|uniref:LysR family transcriptional regulator n=1 Tax=Vineibacter terrae TaxID=2586908 RepID=UPI002E2F8E50|nr:LysR family transcriptional regulator [Vineibacter terrae]HEX2887323.1 LysR family transcriptional regulator [Vineibacter terrae]
MTGRAISTRLPNLRGLEAFVCVGNAGSIRAAAVQLHLTPSAVSRRIAALEHDMDTALLVRTPLGISLTPHGRALHRIATRAFGAIARHIAEQRATHKRIVIKAPHSFASGWLARHMPRLRQRFAAIAFAVETSPRIEPLAAGEIAIRFGFGDWRDGAATRLVGVPMQAVAGMAYRGRERLTRADLRATRILLVSGTERAWSLWLAANRLGPLAGLQTLAFDNTDVALRAAAAGTGITLAGAGGQDAAGSRLVRFPAMTADVGAGYYLVVPRAQRGMQHVRDVAQWLRAQFRQSTS